MNHSKVSLVKDFAKSRFQRLYYIYFILSVPIILSFPKGDVLLWINSHHTSFLDLCFKYLTFLGDGSIFAILLVLFLFYRYVYALATLVTALVQGIMVLILKKVLFNGMERPLAFFDGKFDLHMVDGVNVHSFNTFPSGHTATAFAVFGLLALAFGRNGHLVSALCLLTAILVGLSRIYLVQHFFIDTVAGSVVGLASMYAGLGLTGWFLRNRNPTWYNGALLRKRR